MLAMSMKRLLGVDININAVLFFYLFVVWCYLAVSLIPSLTFLDLSHNDIDRKAAEVI